MERFWQLKWESHRLYILENLKGGREPVTSDGGSQGAVRWAYGWQTWISAALPAQLKFHSTSMDGFKISIWGWGNDLLSKVLAEQSWNSSEEPT